MTERPLEQHGRVGSRPAVVLLAGCLLLAALAASVTSAQTAGVNRDERTPVGHMTPDWIHAWRLWVASGGGDGGPPPPALRPYFQRFLPIYISYQSLPLAGRPTFSQWLIMHGIVQPTTHQAMLLLYEWAQRPG